MTTATQYRQHRLEDFNRHCGQARFWRAAALGIGLVLILVAASVAYFAMEWWSLGVFIALTGSWVLFLHYGYIRFRCPVCEQEVGDNRASSALPTQCPTCRTSLQ